VASVIGAAYAERRAYALEHRVIWPDGSVRTLDCRGKVEVGEDGEPARLLGTAQDVTEAGRVQRALEDSERLLSAGFEGASTGMAVVSPDGRWLRVNPALCRMTGYSQEQLLGVRFENITHAGDLAADLELVRRTLAGEIPGYEMEKRYRRGDGSTLWALLSVTLVRDSDGAPHYFVSQLQDIGERKRYEAELRRLAEQDPLTGLLNHRTFFERLATEIDAARSGERPLSIVVLDLDHFKQVNDRHGHPIGDEVLRETARLLSELAGEGAVLARIGGEEFAWILPGATSTVAEGAAERVRRAVRSHRFVHGGQLTISAGICELGPVPDAEQLYARADAALYWAKQHGRNLTHRFA
jgi:diguanylate cyclase (GGDEF)-like protein/PAS domain S-box-containing protein